MRKLFLLFPLLFLACSDVSFNYNGLQCPTNDPSVIENDMTECRVWDMKDIEKSFAKDPECKKCLEEKGYKIEGIDGKHDESH